MNPIDMKKLFLLAFLIFLLGGTASQATTPAKSLNLFAFYDCGQSNRSLSLHASKINILAPEWYSLDLETLQVKGSRCDYDSLASYKKRGIQIWPVVNAQLSSHSIFASPSVRDRLIKELMAISEGNNGITLDIEGISKNDRSGFSKFSYNLSHALHSRHKKLAIYVPRRISTSSPSDWTAAFNYSALVRSSDLLLVSSYSESWDAPGPVVTTKGLSLLLDFVHKISPTKIAPTLGAIGQEWTKGNRYPIILSTRQSQAQSVGKTLLHSGGETGYAWGDHTVWFESTSSLIDRLKAVKNRNFTWVALFLLGGEEDRFWRSLALN